MHVYSYLLTEDKSWAITIIDDVSIGAEGEPVHPLAGFLTMEVLEDSSIDFHVNCAGLSSFRTEAFVPEEPRFSQAVVSLSEHTKIVLDEEIPVALITYTEMGKSMRIPSLEDCRDPSAFENTDFVQMITLMFTAEAS